MVLILKLLMSLTLFAESYTEIKNVKVTSDKMEQYDIRQDLTEKAIQKATAGEVRKILGSKNFKAYQSNIIKNIYSQSNKYISSIVPLQTNINAPDSSGTYSIKLSQESLMTLLRKSGLFYNAGTKMKVLPLISYTDKIDSKNYFWWGGGSPFASRTGMKTIKNFHNKITQNLLEEKFNVINPIKANLFKKVPIGQQFLKLDPMDLKSMAEAMGANAVVFGDISISKGMKKSNTYQATYKLKTIQIDDMKTLSEVNIAKVSLPGSKTSALNQLLRSSNEDVSKVLNESLKNIWEDGSIGAKTYIITLKGNLKYKQYKSFKKDLITNIGAVNSINEKNFSPGSIVLEVQSPSSIKNVVKRLKKSKFSKYKVNVNQDSKSSLELDIQSW